MDAELEEPVLTKPIVLTSVSLTLRVCFNSITWSQSSTEILQKLNDENIRQLQQFFHILFQYNDWLYALKMFVGFSYWLKAGFQLSSGYIDNPVEHFNFKMVLSGIQSRVSGKFSKKLLHMWNSFMLKWIGLDTPALGQSLGTQQHFSQLSLNISISC